jgi:preprotein translocase subunit SecD
VLIDNCLLIGGNKVSKKLGVRSTIYALLIIVSLVYLVPTFSNKLPEWWLKFLPKEKIKLGLDLQGGMQLILEVDTIKAIEAEVETAIEDIKDELRSEKIRYLDLKGNGPTGIELTLIRDEDMTSFEAFMNSMYTDYIMEKGGKTGKGQVVHMKMKQAAIQQVMKTATDQALETIRNRIDQFGVNEPYITTQADNRILIQLPGLKDPDRAIKLIGKTAQLEFKLVDEENNVNDAIAGNMPAGDEVLYQVAVDPETGKTEKNPYLLKKRTSLTGKYITDARVKLDSQYGEPYVLLSFDRRGARIFEKITGENIEKRLAIVLDNNVHSAPVIKDRISGGTAVIENIGNTDEARDLAIVLRAGALPAPVKILEQRLVGPSLGQDSIDQGINAMILGGVLVVLFMIAYYGLSGLIAVFALALNTLLIVAGLAAFSATLTLPGLAGIILSIGMAVDANVLIYERIREELRIGKTLRGAVETGYERATITIFDSNLTTLITAVILFQFGTGPVKGFAVTLTIGLIANFITAVYVTRVIFDYLVINLNWKKMSI